MNNPHEAQTKIKKLEEDRRRQELADLEAILKTPAGRRFIWRLLEFGRPLQDAFTGNANTYYILGKQAFAKAIFADCLTHFGPLYLQMQAEAQAEALKRQQEEREEEMDNG